MTDRLTHLSATFSQLEERVESLKRERDHALRELEELKVDAARWRAQGEWTNERWFQKAYALCKEQRSICAAKAQKFWRNDAEAAAWILDSDLVVEAEDIPTRFDLRDVPFEGGGLT